MVWDKLDPQASTKVSDSPSIFQGNWQAIESWTSTEHGSLASANSGSHVPGQAGVVWTGTLSALSGAISAPPTGSMAIASASSDGRIRIYINTSTAGSGTWVEQQFPHNALADLTSGNPHPQYASLTADPITAITMSATNISATNVSATNYLNIQPSLPSPLTATSMTATSMCATTISGSTISGGNIYGITITGTTITGTGMCATNISATTYYNVTPTSNVGSATMGLATEYVGSDGSYTACKEMSVPFAGTYRAAFDLAGNGSYGYGKIYVTPIKGTPTASGTERANAGAYNTYYDDVTVGGGYIVGVYAYGNYKIKNFKLYSTVSEWAVVTDRSAALSAGNVPIPQPGGGG